MERLRAGNCLVRNPVSRTTLHRIDLTRSNVDCIEFMTKDPRPMLPYLKELNGMGHMYVFQVTMTPYDRRIEPGVDRKADISDACAEISERIGRDRILWRYDPVLYTGRIDSAYHTRKFATFCNEASRWTDRCIFSFVDTYGRTPAGYRPPTRAEEAEFCKMAVRTAEDRGISLSVCCAKKDYSEYGIENRGCIDAAMMRSLDIPYETASTPVRGGCRCVKAIDIGEYDTCGHDCIYCYANRSEPSARRTRLYCDDTELLWGAVMPRDRVVDLRGRDAARLEDW